MKDSEAAAIANPGTGGARAVAAFAGRPDVDVSITRTPRKLEVDLDGLPPAREDGPRPIPRRFAGRMYEAVTSSGMNGEGMTIQKSALTYGLAKIYITRDIVGAHGQFWFAGDEISGCPINLAIQLVSEKSAMFDKSEFKSEGEIEALEKLGYEVLPPMVKARDREEFKTVIAKKTAKWMSGTVMPTPAST